MFKIKLVVVTMLQILLLFLFNAKKHHDIIQVLVEETGDDLLFLHQVHPGGASRSYGIEAARLAGVPVAVVQRARQVRDQLGAEAYASRGSTNKNHRM